MNDLFPTAPRSFYRAFIISLALHIIFCVFFFSSSGKTAYINSGLDKSKVIWLSPQLKTKGKQKNRELPLPEAAAKKAVKKKALTKTEKKRQKNRKAISDALKKIKQSEQQQNLLARALSEVQQSAANEESENIDQQEPASGEQLAGAGQGEGQLSFADYQYRLAVRKIYGQQMDQVLKQLFRGKNLSYRLKVVVDNQGKVIKYQKISGSGNFLFDSEIEKRLQRIEQLPIPSKFFIDNGIFLDINPQQ